MYPVTCFLCEGSDHVPAKCPLYPAVIAAIQLSRANQLAAWIPKMVKPRHLWTRRLKQVPAWTQGMHLIIPRREKYLQMMPNLGVQQLETR
jgi:hypothetical protein